MSSAPLDAVKITFFVKKRKSDFAKKIDFSGFTVSLSPRRQRLNERRVEPPSFLELDASLGLRRR